MQGLVIKNGKVINKVMLKDDWTGKKGEWPVPDGCEVVLKDGQMGDTYADKKIIRKPEPPEPPETDDQKIKRLRAAALKEIEEDQLMAASSANAIAYQTEKAKQV